MRILHYIYDHPKNPWVGGGGAHRVARIARGLADRGHEIEVVSGRFPEALASESERVKQKFLGSSSGYVSSVLTFTLAAWVDVTRRSREFDLVLEDFAVWNPVFTHRLGRRPAILQIQNFLGEEIPRRYGPLARVFVPFERLYPKGFDHVALVGEALKSRYGLRDATVIPMGFEDCWLERPLELGEYIGFIGRIHFQQKGLDRLIEAARNTRAPIRIAGRGPDVERLEAAIRDLDHVDYVGPVEGEAKTRFFREARFIVAPSRFEGLPLVTIEAAAFGKPLVVSQIDELAFVARNGLGLAIDVDDADLFARTLDAVWMDTYQIERTGRVARAYSKAYTWTRIVDQFENYCLRVIREAPQSRR